MTSRWSACRIPRAIASRSPCRASSCRTNITATPATSRSTATRKNKRPDAALRSLILSANVAVSARTATKPGEGGLHGGRCVRGHVDAFHVGAKARRSARDLPRRPDAAFGRIRGGKAARRRRLQRGVPRQACCGQPAYNSGDRKTTREIAEQVIEAFAPYDYVVVPSCSCAGLLKVHYPRLFRNDPNWLPKAEAFAAKTFELVSFLVDVLGVTGVAPSYEGSVTYHDACSGLPC